MNILSNYNCLGLEASLPDARLLAILESRLGFLVDEAINLKGDFYYDEPYPCHHLDSQ